MLSGLKKVFSAFIDKISTVELSNKNLGPLLNELLIGLVENDVAYIVAEELIEELRAQLIGKRVERGKENLRKMVISTLRGIILRIFEDAGKLDLLKMIEFKRRKGEPFVVLFLGPNGHGKTTTIAKIAYLLLRNNYSVVFACSDTFRAGAEEQLEAHAKKLGVRVIKHKYGADPAAVAYDAVTYARSKGIDVVLIDTAGRMQTNRNLMEELRKIARVVKPDLKLFVGDALTGNDAVEQASAFDREVGVDAIVLTKVDADVKGGTALSIVKTIGKPILYLGTGPRYEDLIPFSPEWLVRKLLGS